MINYYPLPNTQIPLFSYSWDLARATRLARLFEQHLPDQKITLIGCNQLFKITVIGSHQSFKITLILSHQSIKKGPIKKGSHQSLLHSSLPAFAVPTNNGWEKVKRDFSQVFASLTSLQTPDYVSLPAKILRAKSAKYDLFFYNQSRYC